MKFVAVIRQVPDGESKLRIQGDRVDLSGATMILDQMDEYAVEEAIRLKERHGGEAVVVGFGPERTEEAIRTALAMGMDRGVHVVYEGFADPVAVAEALVEVLKEEAPTLVLTGGQQADWDSQALGGALAEALGVPVVAWTTALELEGDTAKAKHDLDEGAEWVRVRLPAVFTTQQGLNEPRYPTLPGIMKAKKKPIDTMSPADLGVDAAPRLTTVNVSEPPARAAGVIVGSVGELIDKLKNDAKVV
jgi:electron transfer flavoprotein beta subunit